MDGSCDMYPVCVRACVCVCVCMPEKGSDEGRNFIHGGVEGSGRSEGSRGKGDS